MKDNLEIVKPESENTEENPDFEIEAEESVEEELSQYHYTSSGEHHHHHHSESGHHGHRHHHHHHRRKSSHKGSQKKKESKLVKFIKGHKNALINALSCTISVALLIVMAARTDSEKRRSADTEVAQLTQTTVKIETTLFSDEVSLVSGAVEYYMSPENEDTATEVYKAFQGYKGGLNVGFPLTFNYDIEGLPTGVEVKGALLQLSENESFTTVQDYAWDTATSVMNIYNLKTGTQYYYRLVLSLSTETKLTTLGSFKTAGTPRILNIEGAANVRDIGGRSTVGGKVVKQGLLFRGSELDGAVEKEFTITDKGREQLASVLGVRLDMDLRSQYESKKGTDALGVGVAHKYYASGMYAEIFDAEGSAKIREIFSDLADKSNYPIYMHCTYGRDRTGTVCYLLGALLGMSDDDLYKEYELSAFTDSYVDTRSFNLFLGRLAAFSGSTTQEKVEGYLLSIGVTQGEMTAIREIFLG